MNSFDDLLPDGTTEVERTALLELWTELQEVDDVAAPENAVTEFRRALRMGLNVADAVAATPSSRTRVPGPWGLALAASVALLLGTVGGLGMGRTWTNGERVAQLEADVGELQRAQAMALLENRSAPDRLRGVRLAGSVSRDEALLNSLLQSATRDPNNNVRLAALDAILPYLEDDEVQQQLLEALAFERSPLIQVTLLDALVAARVVALLPVLEELERRAEERGGLLPEVRERAAFARSVLQ